MWKETVAYAKELQQRGINVKFSYFISAVYFLKNKNRALYHGPHHKQGKSDIGFSEDDPKLLSSRISAVNDAFLNGHEIGSHAVGHFDGSKWSTEDWISENEQFDNLIFNIDRLNDIKVRPAFTKDDIKGIRAPLLAQTTSLFYPALVQTGFEYDTSNVNKPNFFPKKVGNIWNFPLASLYITSNESDISNLAKSGKKTLSMDYNFYVAHSLGQPLTLQMVTDHLVANGMREQEAKYNAQAAYDKKIQQFEDETYWTYMSYFNHNYHGGRAPIHIGHHFSKWNKGAYWNGMKRFMAEVCGKENVKCITYSELTKELERNPSLAKAWEQETDLSNRLPASESKVPQIALSIEKNRYLRGEVIHNGAEGQNLKDTKLSWLVYYSNHEKTMSSPGTFAGVLKNLIMKIAMGKKLSKYSSKLDLQKVLVWTQHDSAIIRAVVTSWDKDKKIWRDIMVASRVISYDEPTKQFNMTTENIEDATTQKIIFPIHDEE
ncbi:MAG: hypothetical protein A2385_10695 [Bdellovibrionales bacterium RIFOXYB1_FULL_39_21]|nr:MAG: hypothetical protein A2385_10695 [Bdellovibrionales bacterium RIFOXYB1_FULL_39_21]OFZ40756.1 MAG: hypothetical protein A2485_17035 [Bdellovibrionales bacterium RIFOXYC12_FULL_39_17]OFZ48178.1 MAG: hypothetical protein A2404_17195 [Bdellovibrionales bacterium RIFOXYC1_FULL_39_130]OFZ75828.1 MAG: hypothetical protein A2560_13695 [Bdellovibrionales bacterium RIFOXYD1_FULL_39_84]